MQSPVDFSCSTPQGVQHQQQRTYICSECNFIAPSSRLLSRHKAITHSDNSLPCPLCPFVTIYQTNLLRHRREVHGILGTKGNKTCKFCDFKAQDNETLIDHHTRMHQDILAIAVERFGKERDHATASNASSTTSTSSTNVTMPTINVNQSAFLTQTPEEIFSPYHLHYIPNGGSFNQCQYPLSSELKTQITSGGVHITTTSRVEASTASNETSLVSNSTDPALDDWSEVEEDDFSTDETESPDIDHFDFTTINLRNIRPSLVEKIEVHIEQLCLIERLETATFLANVKADANHSLRYKCTICPAEFNKSCSYKFHMSLHGYDAEICCELCNYGVDFEENLYMHQQLHFANLE